MAPKALITGITGQDGSYLTEWLLGRGYEVHGVVRRTSSLERSRLGHLYADPSVYGRTLHLHYADLDDPTTLRRVLVKVGPDEVYHLAGQSHVGLSFDIPESTCEMTAMGTLRLLEMIRDLPRPPRLFHAGSSEMFGRPAVAPQDEETPFQPVSPYGAAKAFAAQMVRIYRDAHGLYAVNGILYNHESPRRGENFVTRKICRAAAAIREGRQRDLALGDTSSRRDWGDARPRLAAACAAGSPVPPSGRAVEPRRQCLPGAGTLGMDARDQLRAPHHRDDPGRTHRRPGARRVTSPVGLR